MSEALVRAAPATQSDFSACRRWIAQHSRSFYLSSLLLPVAVRQQAFALYAFCRRADDAADEAEADPARARVAALRARLDRLYAGQVGQGPEEAIDRAFYHVVLRAGIPQALPARLLRGMEMDVEGTCYGSWEELLGYCFNVASTVGLMMTAIMGHTMGPERHAEVLLRACDLGVAMQLTNIARDIGEDARRGRIYLPEDLLAACGTCGAEVLDCARRGTAPPPGVRAAVAEVLARAEDHYAAADLGIPMLPRPCRLAIRSARLIYAAIGDQIRARGLDSITGRAVVPTGRKLLCVGRALVAGLRARPPRTPTRGPADALLLRLLHEVGMVRP
ncbi:MAG: phytoene/squalene synthase family protein [Myxococcales bacterium]|nr:phytoene/squalene synthase family protein [Myxococcota bacterium]MDW8283487.1 phytoene/squalene synthase family protein [Myxococcales bacterium]